VAKWFDDKSFGFIISDEMTRQVFYEY